MLPELKENLIKAGKEEGCISFDDLNELLPDEIKDPNEIESIFNFLGAHSIEIVTVEENGEKRTLSGEIWERDDSSTSNASQEDEMSLPDEETHEAEETTTTYLREMGRFDLLTPEEEASIGAQMGDVLDYFNKLKELDVEGLEPTAHPVPLKNIVRRDETRPSLSHEEALRNAPSEANGLFSVPKIVE